MSDIEDTGPKRTRIFNSTITGSCAAFIAAGLICFVFTSGNTSSDALAGSIAGYACLAAAVAVTIGSLFLDASEQLLTRQESDQNNLRGSAVAFLSLVYRVCPLLIILGIIAYSLYLIIVYKARISSGHVHPDYSRMSFYSTLLIVAQMGVFYYFMTDKGGKNFKVANAFMYLIGTFNIFTVVTMGIVLKYFSTDG
jgi:hypothetical protein